MTDVVLAEQVASQADVFAEWGGVVPEIAARGHVGYLPQLIDNVLRAAAVDPADLDAIAVGSWPGLIGSLLVGLTSAKMCALRWHKPLIACDHVASHLAAVHLSSAQKN